MGSSFANPCKQLLCYFVTSQLRFSALNRKIVRRPAIWVFVLSGLLLAVQFDVALGRFTGVMHRMQMMPMGGMRMMRRNFVFASSMMLGRFAMVLRGVFMVFSGFRVMFFKFLWH